MNIVLSFVFLALSLGLTKLFLRCAQGSLLMDKPNERSMHQVPTVRGGGLVFVGLALLSIPLLCVSTQTPWQSTMFFFLGIVVIAAISFLDDLYQLSARQRFLVQILVGMLLVFDLKPQELDAVAFSISSAIVIVPLVIFMVVGAINHFNFMDGLDGFCASQAIFLCATYAFLLPEASFYQGFCLLLLSSLFGFLRFNFPPARLFMGDVGSATLGFITFALALIAQVNYQIPLIYWFILNGLFLFDASVTLVRRVFKGESWALAHRKHAYQRLRQSGKTVEFILFGQMLLNLSFFLLVFLLKAHIIGPVFLVLLQIGLIFFIYINIEKNFPMFQSEFLP